MKRAIIILLLVCVSAIVKAQTPFTTIVPQEPVVVGEAFQVQYVVEDASKAGNFKTPAFQGFRIASGPNIYPGTTTSANNNHQSKNFVFTLVALRTGRLIIPGTVITIDGKPVQSNNSFVEIISKEAADKKFVKEIQGNSDYFLRPGENVQDKIRQNLFLKLMVSKRNCFVGEPVLATFKLYSRLESKSDIVKNPGFYGFTVHDIINLSDKQVVTENVNGKPFDVHIIRKVQLYPLQAGVFIIDAMEVKNKVEFSRSVVNKKTEQQIVEGVLVNNEADEKKENAEEFESSMSTEPITINVKPLPEKAKPILFDGATGLFTISAVAVKNKLSRDEGDILEVTISGKGNFIQLNAPVIQWPKGIEGFEPTAGDALDKFNTPLTGSRTYRYPFISATVGKYTIPAIAFSFFNPDSGNYKTVSTNALEVNIEEKKADSITMEQYNTKNIIHNNIYWFFAGGILVVLGGFFWVLRRRRKITMKKSIQTLENNSDLSAEQLLAPAALLINEDDKTFYSSLRKAVWNYLTARYSLAGSEVSKRVITERMNKDDIEQSIINKLFLLIEQCEKEIYTKAIITEDKKDLLKQTELILNTINLYSVK